MATNRMGDTLIPIEEGRNNDRRRRKTLEDATCFEIVREFFRTIWFCVRNFGKCILSYFGIKFKRSTPTSEDDSLLENSQEQEMLELRKANICYKEALSEAMSKLDALEISSNDALSTYQKEKRTLNNEVKRYKYDLERAMREIEDLRKSKDDALSR